MNSKTPIKEEDIDEILDISDHIVFNSLNQWNKYKDKVIKKGVSAGIRVNPKYSEIETDIYNISKIRLNKELRCI